MWSVNIAATPGLVLSVPAALSACHIPCGFSGILLQEVKTSFYFQIQQAGQAFPFLLFLTVIPALTMPPFS